MLYIILCRCRISKTIIVGNGERDQDVTDQTIGDDRTFFGTQKKDEEKTTMPDKLSSLNVNAIIQNTCHEKLSNSTEYVDRFLKMSVDPEKIYMPNDNVSFNIDICNTIADESNQPMTIPNDNFNQNDPDKFEIHHISFVIDLMSGTSNIPRNVKQTIFSNCTNRQTMIFEMDQRLTQQRRKVHNGIWEES